MLNIFKRKRRKVDEIIFQNLKEEINELIEENDKLKKANEDLTTLYEKKKEECSVLIEKNEELHKAINILQTEKSSKSVQEQVNRKKWLYGFHDEEYKGGSN